MRDRELRLLILGGTAEAAALARAAVARFGPRLRVATALAGRTARAAALPGTVRRGGFGGVDGLAAFIAAEGIDLLIDATHPFAAQISHHARLAAETACVKRLMLLRPAWRPRTGDRWIEVADMAAAASVLPALGPRAFLTIGARGLEAFAGVADVAFVVRLIEPPRQALPLAAALVIAQPPFTLDEERLLLHRHAIAAVVAKASGGARPAKLDAAREAGLPVVLAARPEPEQGASVASVGGALSWLEDALGG
jgi:precorrin-6A/cobalt-precorrin-6A reductase